MMLVCVEYSVGINVGMTPDQGGGGVVGSGMAGSAWGAVQSLVLQDSHAV
jgi:hypothetical protein